MIDTRALWKDRFRALNKIFEETELLNANTMDEHGHTIKTFFPNYDVKVPSNEAIDDKETAFDLLLLGMQITAAKQLLNSLKTFIGEASGYFVKNYYDKDGALLNEDEAFRQRFVMRVLLYQGAYDLNIIQQALQQRRIISDENDQPKLSFQGLSLLLADSLAVMALTPIINAGYLPESTNAICYMDRDVRIRLVPYDDTVLIRVASTSFWKRGDDIPSQDLLAVLHEIGHHLYWNGKAPGADEYLYQVLADKMKEIGIHNPKDWRRRWLEEIFADAYALVQGGPVVMLNFQEMLSDDLPNHFNRDVDKHPIPEIRPLIQARLLRKMQDKQGDPLYQKMHNKLERAWQQDIGKDPRLQTYQIHDHGTMTGKEILQALYGLLDKVVEVLQPLYPEIVSEKDKFVRKPGVWSTDEVALHNLYAQFAEATSAKHIDKEAIWDAFIAGPKSISFQEIKNLDDPKLRFLFMRFSSTPKSFDERVEELTGKKPDEHTDDKWIDIFLSRGWSTEGPEGSIGG